MLIEEIRRICFMYNIKNYTINDDLTIDVNGDVNLSGEYLKELPLNFRNVSGYFNCGLNYLTCLKGSPIYVGLSLNFGGNNLTSLEGAPSYVGDNFIVSNNYLKTLEGAPSYVGGYFCCYDNPLVSIKGIPLNLSKKQLFLNLPFNYTYEDYLVYCRDIKFKKILK